MIKDISKAGFYLLNNDEKLKEFLIAITTRKIKNKKQAEKVLKLRKINILKQTHSNKIVVVKKERSLRNIKADGIITNVKNYPIAVKVADCIGSIIVDPRKKVVAAIHSGWRGIVGKIIFKAIDIMKKKFRCNSSDLIVLTSPCIGPCCYEVGRDLYNKLKKQKMFSNIFNVRNDKVYMDLQKANKNILTAMDVKQKNIHINRLCTKCNNDIFFSYRAEGKKTRRMYVVVKIK